jgi:flagellar biosynthesis GTPase FlhF
MLVQLKKLKPNPLRDFTVDPIERTKVAELAQSIQEDGFWGGIVCRQINGDIEIAAGHHRVEAAIEAGIKSADLFVAEDLDDAAMVRIYARENATQRGNTATAQAGSVAAAVRVLAKMILGGRLSPQLGRKSLEHLRGNIASDRGIGQDVVEEFLDGIPGVTSKVVEHQLANLKSSGHYARIIAEVKELIEEENREALKRLERAEKEHAAAQERAQRAEAALKERTAQAKAAKEEADRKRAAYEQERAEIEAALAEKRRAEVEAELKKFDALRQTRDLAVKAVGKSAEREVTFDFEGVAKHFQNAHQIDVFRQEVTGKGIKPYLPVQNQAGLAKQFVALAKQYDAELTGEFIRQNIMGLVLQAKATERKWSREDREALLKEDWVKRFKVAQQDFVRGCDLMQTSGLKLRGLLRDKPRDVLIPFSTEFRTALKDALKNLTTLSSKL